MGFGGKPTLPLPPPSRKRSDSAMVDGNSWNEGLKQERKMGLRIGDQS